MGAYKLHIGTNTEYLKWTGTELLVAGKVTITGGSGIANLADAGDLATKDKVSNSDLGLTIISGGYLRTDLIKVRKVYVGSGTNEDIEFEDSGIRLYDVGSSYLRFFQDGRADFVVHLGAGYLDLATSDEIIQLSAGLKHLLLRDTGTLQLPNLASAPTGVTGGICMINNALNYWNGSAWVVAT